MDAMARIVDIISVELRVHEGYSPVSGIGIRAQWCHCVEGAVDDFIDDGLRAGGELS